MAVISKKDKERLYRHVKHDLGYPIRPLGIESEINDMMDTFFEMSIEDYSSIMNSWLISQQWVGLQGVDLDTTNLFDAFTTKSNDFMRSFTFAYSKQVGLGANAPEGTKWQLQRDFVTIEPTTQVYEIPAGREVNEVLWVTPPSIDQGMGDPFALGNWSAGQMGWGYQGRPAQYVQPTYSLLMGAQDRRMKEKILQSTLSYRITGGANGTKLLYLYPIPGTREEISSQWGKRYAGTKVWYFYYETQDNRDDCLSQNKDIVKLPSDVPVDILDWEDVNTVARVHIRDLLISRMKITIGGIRGFYSGELGSTDKALQMDYRHLLDEGEKLKETTENNIKEALDKLSLVNLTDERARIAQNVNTERSFQPPRIPIHLK